MAGKKQFDVERVLDAAMTQFWRAGYADTSIDDLSRVTGLNRSSLYSSFGGKDALFLRCLDRYAGRYGDAYDAALSGAGSDPVAAVRAFLDVTLARIADPDVPDGCLIAQSVMAVPTLSPDVAAHALGALGRQRHRVGSALRASGMPAATAETFALQVAAVNQSLAVMSRGGASPADLESVVAVSVDGLAHAVADDPPEAG